MDLRSDTVTRPTAAMRTAMAEAEVGDDGYREDPTVRRLEAAFAARVGKPAALFVPSGTMSNQIALRLLGRPGTLVICGARQHIVRHEAAAAGMNAAVQLQPVTDIDGVLDPDQVDHAIRGADHHLPSVSAIAIENTHMAAGGAVWPEEPLRALTATHLPVHLDGARLFNAEVASGVSAADLADGATTVTCCLSKGLGAPVGSVLAGPNDLIDQARVERKRLGGGMRQAGVIAAAGLVALDDMVSRLAEDHGRARRLAEAVADRFDAIDPATVRTNAVIFAPTDAARLIAHLEEAGVRAGTSSPGRVRLMTHLDVDDAGIDRACAAMARCP